MDYVILGALLLGGLLFVLGWLRVVVAGFQHHPLTGLIALVPGVNLLTLPSLWHRVGVWVISGLVGVALATGAWFAGAEDALARYLPANNAAVAATPAVPESTSAPPAPPPAPQSAVVETVALDLKQPAASAPVVAAPTPAAVPVVTQVTQDLPKAALYRVTFSELAVEKLPEQVGQYVRITQTDGRSREGKLLSSTASSVELEERQGSTTVTRTLPFSDIRTAALLAAQGGD